MSLQEDGLVFNIDHNDSTQTSFNGGRGSTFTGFSTSGSPLLMKYRDTFQMLPEIPVKLHAQAAPNESLSEQPSPITTNRSLGVAEAIYDSGDSAKIHAWERFVAAKTKDHDLTLGVLKASDINSDISLDVGAPSALDNQAVRINDKSMIVDSHIQFSESPLNGSTKSTHTSDSLS